MNDMSRIATTLCLHRFGLSIVFVSLWLLLALVAPAGAQTGTEPLDASEPAREAGGAYRIGPRDVVRIDVFEEEDLSGDFTVNEDGTLRLPLVGNVPIEGLTEDGFATRLQEILQEGLLQRASVSVEVLEFRSRPISVLGAVRQPGSLNFPGRLTLIEAITAAGGLTEGHGASIHVLRRAPNGLIDQVTVPVDGLLVNADATVNLPLFANDLINVPPASNVTIYLLGEVSSPGAITFKSTDRLTLLAAIARAGGLSERASNKVRIQRSGPDGKMTEIMARYKRILSGDEPDPALRDGDVVVVKESFF